MKTNKFAADCNSCKARVAANEGSLTRGNGRWVVTCIACQEGGASKQEEVVVAEVVKEEINVVAEEVVVANLKIARPDTLSDKARVWALDVQARLVNETITAFAEAFARAATNEEKLLLICMRNYFVSSLVMRIKASIWIDWRFETITADKIIAIANNAGRSVSDFLSYFLLSISARETIDADYEAELMFAKERAARIAEESAKRQEEAQTIVGKIEQAKRLVRSYGKSENVVFTLENTETKNTYAYCVSVRLNAILVSVATGGEKTGKNSALFVGEIADGFSFTVSPACVLPKTSKRLRALVWLFSLLSASKPIPAHIKINLQPSVEFCWRDGEEARVVSWGADDYEVDDLGEEVSYYSLMH
jgi:hypothetical protein